MGTAPTEIPLILGTRNRKKGLELAQLIRAPVGAQPSPRSAPRSRTLAEYPDAPEVVEDADTFAGNARKKASEAAVALRSWVLADDSGLTVDALGGRSRASSRARYAGEHGDDEANNRKVLEALSDVPDDRRRGRGVRSAAWPLADPSGTIRAGSVRGVPRPDHARPARGGRLRLRRAFPDRRIPQDLRRAGACS